MEAQSPLLEGSCQERSLDWRQERWETGWLGTQHYCGTAGVKPTEQHRSKDHGIDGRLENYKLLVHTARGSWEKPSSSAILGYVWRHDYCEQCRKKESVKIPAWHGLVWLNGWEQGSAVVQAKLSKYFLTVLSYVQLKKKNLVSQRLREKKYWKLGITQK